MGLLSLDLSGTEFYIYTTAPNNKNGYEKD